MKKLTAILFSVLLTLSLAACAGGEKPAESPAATSEDIPAASSEDVPAASFPANTWSEGTWDGTALKLTDIRSEIDAAAEGLTAPEGKYVSVKLTITDGSIEVSSFKENYTSNITFGGYSPATMIAQGVSIENDKVFAVGTIELFFDVPADFDASSAVFELNDPA